MESSECNARANADRVVVGISNPAGLKVQGWELGIQCSVFNLSGSRFKDHVLRLEGCGGWGFCVVGFQVSG